MACEVTIKDIQREIKVRLLNRFETARPIQGGSAVFISINDGNKNFLRSQIERATTLLNKTFNSQEYGDSVSAYMQNEFGYTVEITPSQELADAMTQQNIVDEVGQDYYMGDEALKEQELFSARDVQNSKKPVTDNFKEYLNYKEAQHKKVKGMLNKLYRDRKNPKRDLNSIREQIDRLTKIESELRNDIEALNKNNVDLMFSTLKNEIADIDRALTNATDVENIKPRLDFIYTFVKGVSRDNRDISNVESLSTFNHPDFDPVSVSVDKLNLKYKEKLRDITDEIIKTDISYANNVLNNASVTPEEIKKMFFATSDINWMEKTFLGITSSGTNDTILPQILKSFLETKVALREAEVKVFQDKLNSVVTRLDEQGTDFEFIFETTKKGSKTGNIINKYSPEFSNQLNGYLNIDKSDLLTELEKYNAKVTWLKQFTNVIDFRKIRVVKEVYESTYPEEFTASEQDIDIYETFLKNTLGVLYEEEIEKVLTYLDNFQTQKESLLEDVDNQYKFKNVARVDPWAFTKHYNSPYAQQALPYNSGGTNTEEVVPSIQYVRFIPLRNVFTGIDAEGNDITKPSGFYNSAFEEIERDPLKLEYWSLLKDIYTNYINPVYSDYSNLSYAKFEKDFIEELSSAKGLKKGTALYNSSKRTFKSFFYEKGYDVSIEGVKADYSDVSTKQIGEFKKVLKFKSDAELKKIANESYIDSQGLDREALIKEIATRQVIGSYSTDINKGTSALLHMAGLLRAKQDTLPIANILLDSHKLSMDDKGEDRARSIERMQNYINRVIRNENEKYRGSTNFLGKDLTKGTLFGSILDQLGKIPFVNKFINKKKAMLFSDSEKQILQYLEELKTKGHDNTISSSVTTENGTFMLIQTAKGPKYTRVSPERKTFISSPEEFEQAFQTELEKKIQDVGLDLNTAGIIQGILKMIILKGLGLNPISGIFNRIEGKNSGLVMDATGKYWTKGNIHEANNFLAFANFLNFLPERLQPEQLSRVQELKKLQILLQNINLIQDRKNELERQSGKSKFDYEKWSNIYQFAVDNPEFKNQGAIFLSVLMDTKIQDTSGNEVPIFDGNAFSIYDNIDGKLVLKEEYRTPENISNWENFDIDEDNLANNQFLLTKQKVKTAISRSQGNYDSLDVIDATKHIWGRALTLFMKWMPEHFMQRFSSGKNFDLTTGQQGLKGRYRSLWDNNGALLSTGVITMFTGLGLSPIAAIAGLGMTGAVVGKYFYDMYGPKQIQREASNTLEFIAFAKTVVISTLNYPLQMFNSNKVISQDFGSKVIPGYEKTNLSQEEINNLQAVARELGIKITLIAFMLLVKKFTWDDEDEKDSDRRQFHNFMDNQLNRIVGSISNWTKPESLVSDAQRFAFLQYLWDVGKTMNSLITLDEKGKLTENAFKASPIPRMLYKPTHPWLDEKEYDKGQSWEDELIKASNSGGEHEATKRYKDLRKDKKEEFESNFEQQGLEGDEFDAAVKRAMQLEFPKKEKGESYLSIMARIDAGEKGKAPKKRKSGSSNKATRSERNTYKNNLKAQGLSNEEIAEIMREEFRNR